MNSYEIMLSESQERMLIVIEKGNGKNLKKYLINGNLIVKR